MQPFDANVASVFFDKHHELFCNDLLAKRCKDEFFDTNEATIRSCYTLQNQLIDRDKTWIGTIVKYIMGSGSVDLEKSRFFPNDNQSIPGLRGRIFRICCKNSEKFRAEVVKQQRIFEELNTKYEGLLGNGAFKERYKPRGN